MTASMVSNLSRTFSNGGGFSRSNSSGPKPFHFIKLHQANMTPLPSSAPQYKSKKGRTCCAAFCCCCLTTCVSTLVAAAVGLGIAALVLWLVLRPVHSPSYTLQDVTFSHLHYSSSARTLSTDFVYTVLADNPNRKIAVWYSYIDVETAYMGQVLAARMRFPGFYQGHRNVTKLGGEFAVTGVAMNRVAGESLDGEIAARQNVTVVVSMGVRAQLRVGILRTPSYSVHINCDVSVRPPVKAGAVAAVACRKS